MESTKNQDQNFKMDMVSDRESVQAFQNGRDMGPPVGTSQTSRSSEHTEGPALFYLGK